MTTWALFGDSIANGLGARTARYVDLLVDEHSDALLDFSASARPITESLELLRVAETEIDVAIVAHGVTEALVRPTDASLRWMPARWRRRGWMDPRTYFSSKPRKRFVQRMESSVRWRMKNALIRITGGTQIVGLEDFEVTMSALLRELVARGSAIIVLGPTDLDFRYFARSASQIPRYATAVRAAAAEANATFVPLNGELDRWQDYCADRFHPNDSGHARIAALITDRMGPTDAA